MQKLILLVSSMLGIAFVIQAQNVGIGTTTPTYPLTVQSSTGGKGIVQKNGTAEVGFFNNGSLTYIQTWTPHDLSFATNGGTAKITIATTTGFVGINNTNPTAQMDINGTLRVRGNGVGSGKVLTSDADGNATWQTPSGTPGTGVGFRARLSTNLEITQAAGEATVTGFTEEYDDGAGFNGSAGTFTAPSAGVYQFVVNMNWIQSSATTGTSIIVARFYRGGNILEQVSNNFTNNTSYGLSQNITSICKLNAGEVITVKVDPQVSYAYTIIGNGGSGDARFSGVKLY